MDRDRLQDFCRAVLIVEPVGSDCYFAIVVNFRGCPGVGSIGFWIDRDVGRARFKG